MSLRTTAVHMTPEALEVGAAAFAQQAAATRKALAFMDRLAPELPTTLLYAERSLGAQVFGTLTRARSFVQDEAVKQGLLAPALALNAPTNGYRAGLHPAALDTQLAKLLGRRSPAAALEADARQTQNQLVKEAFLRAAKAWRGRAGDPGFEAARSLRPGALQGDVQRATILAFDRPALPPVAGTSTPSRPFVLADFNPWSTKPPVAVVRAQTRPVPPPELPDRVWMNPVTEDLRLRPTAPQGNILRNWDPVGRPVQGREGA